MRVPILYIQYRMMVEDRRLYPDYILIESNSSTLFRNFYVRLSLFQNCLSDVPGTTTVPGIRTRYVRDHVPLTCVGFNSNRFTRPPTTNAQPSVVLRCLFRHHPRGWQQYAGALSCLVHLSTPIAARPQLLPCLQS